MMSKFGRVKPRRLQGARCVGGSLRTPPPDPLSLVRVTRKLYVVQKEDTMP